MLPQSHLGVNPKELKSGSQRDIYSPMPITALLTALMGWMQAAQMPIIIRTEKENVVSSCNEISSALKRNEILAQATTRMNLEDMLLSEISQILHDSIYMGCLELLIHRNRKQKGDYQGWGKGVFSGYCKIRKLWRSVPQ